VGNSIDLPISNDHISFTPHDGAHQLRDAGSLILVISIGVDNNVSTRLQAGVQTPGERNRQTPIPRKSDDMIHSQLACQGCCLVRASVVNHQSFNDLDPRYRRWQVGQSLRQCDFFIKARDLNDQFHVM
jgi:hypothetical protein